MSFQPRGGISSGDVASRPRACRSEVDAVVDVPRASCAVTSTAPMSIGSMCRSDGKSVSVSVGSVIMTVEAYPVCHEISTGAQPELRRGTHRPLTWHPARRSGSCGCSSMVELQLPKLITRVRFPSSAPRETPGQAARRTGRRFCLERSRLRIVPQPQGTCEARCRITAGVKRPLTCLNVAQQHPLHRLMFLGRLAPSNATCRPMTCRTMAPATSHD